MMRWSLPLLLVAGCHSTQSPTIEIHTTPDLSAVVTSFAEQVPWNPPVKVVVQDDLAAIVASPDAQLVLTAHADLTGCTECFRASNDNGSYGVHGDGPLGVQYGLATLLEAAGFKFHSPLHPQAPATIGTIPDSILGAVHAPEKKLRGVHLHTIHPIEAYNSHWADGPLDDAKKIHHWIVANRGNYIQWVALNDIQKDPTRAAAWQAKTKELVDDAHNRGLRVGIGVQLYGASDLQKGFNLINTPPSMVVDPTAEIDGNLALFAGLGFDVVNISFGEFSAFDPAKFIQALNIATKEIQTKLGAEVATLIHVGGLNAQQVTYMGETLPYYFLVKFADPSIDPWVHTVMYYDLYEDTGGAYDMTNFDGHRQYIYDRLTAGKPVGYFPENAYWIAFDDSVPLYLPLYVRSRWLDMSQMRAWAMMGGHADLDEHVQFSSGFEWGYWQQERATLRSTFELPSQWEDFFNDLFPSPLAADLIALTNAQHDALIGQRLAAYLAGRDAYIDTGDQANPPIHSQPDRPSFAEVAAMSPADRAAWKSSALDPLGAFATQLGTIRDQIVTHADANDQDQSEVLDGAAIDAARGRYIHDLYAAAYAFAEKQDYAALITDAMAALTDAQKALASRDTLIPPILRADSGGQATIYPFGYLAQADTLCYWTRELVQLQNLVTGGNQFVDGCIF
jgi:hypothetical protein